MSPKFKKGRVDSVQPLTKKEIEEIKARYSKANESEKAFLNNIFSYISDPKQLVHLFRGAHIELVDQGSNYESWSKNFKDLTNRTGKSSHQSDKDQYSIQGNLVVECLFGTRQNKKGNRHSWVQLESHTTGAAQLLGHMASWVTYKLTGENVGPFGTSKHTEANPLVLYPGPKSRMKKQMEFWKEILFENPAEVTEKLLEKYEKLRESGAPIRYASESSKESKLIQDVAESPKHEKKVQAEEQLPKNKPII